MTATEMEDVLKNLDRRLTNVEQILPTLTTKQDLKEALEPYATKEELKAGLADVRQEMRELFSEAKRHAVMLFERTHEQLGVLAEHLADISRRLPRG